jgi:hypothetical protein
MRMRLNPYEEAIHSLIAREWLSGHDHVTVYKVESQDGDGTISFARGTLRTLDEVLVSMRQQIAQQQEQAQRDLEYAASVPGLIAKAMSAQAFARSSLSTGKKTLLRRRY